MPFSSDGSYTPPAAAENAFPGKIIASADWNTIFTDISAAITTLGQQNWTNNPRVVNVPGDIAVAITDLVILVQASAPNITLPPSSTKLYPVRIIGAATGIFTTHNSLIVPDGIETISGQADVTLDRDYQIATFYPLPSGGYVVAFG